MSKYFIVQYSTVSPFYAVFLQFVPTITITIKAYRYNNPTKMLCILPTQCNWYLYAILKYLLQYRDTIMIVATCWVNLLSKA